MLKSGGKEIKNKSKKLNDSERKKREYIMCERNQINANLTFD